ncbi:MAG: UrcA family protein [Steroidobacteraceae bacterium]
MKTKCNMGKAALLIGAVLLSTGAMASSVEDAVVVQSVQVKYSVSEAATSVGAAELYASLHAAARKVCVETFGRTTVGEDALAAKCISAAVTAAVADVSIPAVTAVHMQGKRGKVAVMTVAGR